MQRCFVVAFAEGKNLNFAGPQTVRSLSSEICSPVCVLLHSSTLFFNLIFIKVCISEDRKEL